MRLELVEPPPSEGWKTLQRAIPDGAAKAVALRLHLHPDTVRCWRREPLSDDAPLSSGKRSILDRVCELVDATFLSNPTGAALIVEHVRSHHQQLLDASLASVDWNRRGHAAIVLREAVEAVNCLNLDAPDDQTIAEIVEAREAFNQVLAQMRARKTSLANGLDRLTEEGRAS